MSSRTSSQGCGLGSGSALQAEPSSRSGACSTIPSSPPASRRRSTPCSRATLRAILPSKSAGCLARCAQPARKGRGRARHGRGVWPRGSGISWKAASISRNTVSTGSSPRRCAQGSMRPTSRVPSAGPGSNFRGRASHRGPRARWPLGSVTYAPPPPVEDGTPPPLDLSAVGERIARSKSTSASSGRTSPACSPARTRRECRRGTRGASRGRGPRRRCRSHGARASSRHPRLGTESLKWTGLDGRERSATVNQLFFVKDKIDELPESY